MLAVAAPAARPDKRLSLRLFHLSNFPETCPPYSLASLSPPPSFLSSAPFHPPMPIPLLLKDPLNVFPSSSSRPHFRFRFLVRLSKTTAASSWNSSFILPSLAKSIGNALEGQGTFQRSLRRKLILLIPPFEQTGVDEESSVVCACSLMARRLAKSVPTLPIWLSPPRLRSQSEPSVKPTSRRRTTGKIEHTIRKHRLRLWTRATLLTNRQG